MPQSGMRGRVEPVHCAVSRGQRAGCRQVQVPRPAESDTWRGLATWGFITPPSDKVTFPAPRWTEPGGTQAGHCAAHPAIRLSDAPMALCCAALCLGSGVHLVGGNTGPSSLGAGVQGAEMQGTRWSCQGVGTQDSPAGSRRWPDPGSASPEGRSPWGLSPGCQLRALPVSLPGSLRDALGGFFSIKCSYLI